MALMHWIERALDELAPRGLDPRMVAGRPVDTGTLATRARSIARALNGVRQGSPKDVVVVWATDFAAMTRRGPYVYVADTVANALSDDGLAFVVAHEMAHHDLLHFAPAMVATRWLGHQPRLELAADAHAADLIHRAGFDPAGALEALDPGLWPEDGPAPGFSLFDSHPPLEQRQRAIRARYAAPPPTPPAA